MTDEGVRHCGIGVHLSKVSASGDWVSGKKGEEIVEALLVGDKNKYRTSGNRVTWVITSDVSAISTLHISPQVMRQKLKDIPPEEPVSNCQNVQLGYSYA